MMRTFLLNCVDHHTHVLVVLIIFFSNDTATTDIYTLSLHDALPILLPRMFPPTIRIAPTSAMARPKAASKAVNRPDRRSEEHTSELQSHSDLVCRLLLEKKNTNCGERCSNGLVARTCLRVSSLTRVC